jgi:hypothetical protein
MNPRQPMFALLTHLNLLHLLLELNGPQSAFVAQLPALTHFAVHSSTIAGGEFSALAHDILAACKSLRVFVFRPLRTQGGLPVEILPSTDDVRFVYMDVQNADFEGCWIVQTRGGTDFWARADAFVEKKRRGEIEPGSFNHPDCFSPISLSAHFSQLPVVSSNRQMTSPSAVVFDFWGHCTNEIQSGSFILMSLFCPSPDL